MRPSPIAPTFSFFFFFAFALRSASESEPELLLLMRPANPDARCFGASSSLLICD